MDNRLNNILGVVMCGGESKRMGSDKGLLKRGNLSWAEIALNILEGIPLNTIISISSKQVDSYKNIFAKDKLIQDSFPVQGPLNGILSVHNFYPEKHLLLLACDLIDMTSDTLRSLCLNYFDNDYDFILYNNGSTLETLCGLYTNHGIKSIKDDILSGSLTRYGLARIVSSKNLKQINLSGKELKDFKNYNYPKDINLD